MNNVQQFPFFVLGAPRSGTTMLRDFLRLHENLESPEETHFYRWCHPFKSPDYRGIYTRNKTLLHHRELDGISNEEFFSLFDQAQSRRELQDAYMALFLEKKGVPGSRWFDKTPQNIYSAGILAVEYPEAKFIHIVRNPLNVVASLREGSIIKQDNINAGINYWLESVAAMDVLQRAYPDRVRVVIYEELLNEPSRVTQDIAEFIGELIPESMVAQFNFKPESNKYMSVLNEKEIQLVNARCKAYLGKFSYS